MSKPESINDSTAKAPADNWTRWIPDPFTSPTKKTTNKNDNKNENKKTKLDLAAQAQAELKLEQALLKAKKKGYAEGYEIGYAEGNKIGKAEGIQQGITEGTEKGYTEGHKNGMADAKSQAQQLQDLNTNFAQALLNVERDIGQNIIRLAVRIAEQVLQSTVKTHPEKILELIDNILHLNLDDSAVLQLYINPQDYDLINKYIQNNPDTKLWRAIPDASITRGGCKARTALGDVDATIETRWRRAISTLGES